MKLTVTDDKQYLRITEATKLEYEQVKAMYVKKTKNYKFSPKYKKGLWDGNITFYKGAFLPAGTFQYLKKGFTSVGMNCEIDGLERLFDMDITEESFNDWCDLFFEDTKWQPRDYQRSTAYRILKSKHCLAQLATSAGKTLISFMVFAYLLDNKIVDKILMVVPNVSLVVQSSGDFMEYNTDKLPIVIQQMYSGAKYTNNANIVVGTYQSLVKEGPEFFAQFQCVFCDEVHMANSASEIKILEQCKTEYKFGLSGTIPASQYADGLTLLSNFGPIVVDIKAKDLQNQGFISTCNITQIKLHYTNEMQQDKFIKAAKMLRSSNKGGELFQLEKSFVIENNERFDVICNFINKADKNCLVLFHRVEYGKKIYAELKKFSNKQVYFISGEISKDTREAIREQCEKKSNVILVASFGTCSTGINIKNLYYLYLVESFKSPTIVLQSIGRLLRKNESIGKSHAEIVDFVDCLYPGCHLSRHGIERKRLFTEQQFPVTEIDL